MAFQIIRHAFRMVFGNLREALKVSVGPYLILSVIVVLAVGMISETGGMFDNGTPMGGAEPMQPTAALIILALIPVVLFTVAWVAVAWHRFILLEEYPGLLPQLAGRPIWAYVGRSILYGFIIALASLPLIFLTMGLAMPLMMAGSGVAAVFVSVLITGFMTYVWLRIAIALPSIAIGQPISMGDSWHATKGMSGTIFGVAFLLMGINGVATVLIAEISAVLPLVGFVLDIAVRWTVLMLGVSILTTLYGHLIEGRDLPI
ncbi:hypothetical protein [Yoonia litorea]|uniref:Uncharacterized protein n=1 Tax=Yoonia litorea TaxID=1123755 RepID=A0A1I6MVI4_9RHOB|nr:hypothetical protein [Yoonia litorea]SFS19722.1 hypothetical protein SAMN05444714_2319 [Yoonia litorea]